MNNTELNSDVEIHSDIQSRLGVWRRRLLWQRFLYVLAAIAVLVLVGHWLATPFHILLQQVCALGLVLFVQLLLSRKWRRLTPGNFLQHLNRRFPEFEESAQLLLPGSEKPGPLQYLQRERAKTVYRQNLAQLKRWQPQLKYRPAMTVIISCLLLVLFSDQLESLPGRLLSKGSTPPASGPAPDSTVVFNNIAIRIEPPAYTGLATIQTDQLDLEFPQGSLVEWTLSFADNGDEYALQLSNDRQVHLERGGDRNLNASAVIDSTNLYRINRVNAEDNQSIGEIYSMTVKLDQVPDIRILEPVVSSLEIPRDGPARFNSQALVKDDYGIATVEILASVAKGSGEGVKFRDQTLNFDRFTETSQGFLYQKEWDLEALGMEPGDEVYFTVIATDNRLPQANTGRSSTLIVRWLEDQERGLAADGLGIDFIPEFFKSQRQIIIDTEQLIEDEAQLADQVFKDTSYEIGQSQAFLKHKYGQYLGDEFDEGSGEISAVDHEATADADDGHEDEHGPASTGDTNKNLNSTADILRLFGHDHGDPEIGPITRRNPVALMKRAVNEMWQAEKHLLQAQPQKALPFEYEAYKYLKLAREADRIYVKRLGFEPPPVSEDRRLTGKRDEILSYRLSTPEQTVGSDEEQWKKQLLKDVYQVLTKYSSAFYFDDNEKELLSALSREFTRWSQQRAALIRHAASLERLSVAGRLYLADCETCLQDLKTIIWNLVEESAQTFHHSVSAWYVDDGWFQDYPRML